MHAKGLEVICLRDSQRGYSFYSEQFKILAISRFPIYLFSLLSKERYLRLTFFTTNG